MTPEAAALRALEALPHAILVVDADGRLVFANPTLWREAGADPARFPPGTSLADILRLLAFRGLLGPGDPAELARLALAQDRGATLRQYRRTADGSRVAEVISTPLPGGGFALCSVDITPLQRAEAAARARVALLEQVLQAQRGGVAAFDAEHRLLLHNPAYQRHSGATHDLLSGRPTLEDIHRGLDAAGAYLARHDDDHLPAAPAADHRRPHSSQRERADGRIVRFSSTPQPDGGFLIESDDVTDLRRAEDDARRRAATLDGVLEALPHGICVYGGDGRVALFNAAYTRLMEGAPLRVGDTLDQVIRRRAEAGEYGPGDAHAVHAREMARDLSKPQARRRQRANGTALDVRTAPLPDGGHISVVTDITELWRAEAEARHRASLLETAMASMRHGLVVYGPDHRVVASNELAERLAGHLPGEIRPGRSLDELVAALHASGALGPEPEATRIAAAAVARDRAAPQRMTRETPDGRVLEVSSDPTPDGGFVVTHVDITELARTRAEAERRAGILQVMLENMRHGICLFDAEQRVVAANALAARMTGLPPTAFRPGRHVAELRAEQSSAGEFPPNWRPPTVPADAQGVRLRAPDRYVRRNGAGMTIEVATDRTPDGGYVRTYTDVTGDHRIREALEQARNDAEAASQAKSRFLATMSHELRTPLSSVIGFAEALLADPAPGRVDEYATAMRDAGRQLLSLIDDILDVARAAGPAERERGGGTDPGLLAEAAAAAAGPAAAQAGLNIDVSAAPGLPRLACDQRRLLRILRALLDNAVKFTPDGGTVAIAALPDGAGGVLFRVADSGIGMAPDDIPRAFEPFTQLDSDLSRRFGGSGLGLHLARLLAQSIGGDLALDSAPGAGTTATLRLPRDMTIPATATEETT
jgi:signal transduction histidine kinase